MLSGIPMNKSVHSNLNPSTSCAIVKGVDPFAVDLGFFNDHSHQCIPQDTAQVKPSGVCRWMKRTKPVSVVVYGQARIGLRMAMRNRIQGVDSTTQIFLDRCRQSRYQSRTPLATT